MKLSRPLVFAIAVAALSLPAQAASLFTFKGSGTIDFSNNAAFTTGAAASLTFTFDADTVDLNPDTENGQYGNPFVGEIVGVLGAETFRVAGPGQRMDVRDLDLGGLGDSFSGFTDFAGAADSGTFAALPVSVQVFQHVGRSVFIRCFA